MNTCKMLRRIRCDTSTILSCVSAVGVITTAVLAAKTTRKAYFLYDELKKKKAEHDEEPTVIDIVKEVGPVYIPSVLMGAATIVCIFGANVLNQQQQARLMSSYVLLNNYYKEYRKKLTELYGEEADIKIRTEMTRSNCAYHRLGLDVPDEKVIFYDEISGDSITCYEREIMDAEYHLNRNFVLKGYASLNEFYSFLGLPQTRYGETVGWSSADGYYWIGFEHRLISRDDGGTDIYSIDMLFPPDEDYLREWE